jgi:RNA polymerase sigma-70 factor (ECF subfamily)
MTTGHAEDKQLVARAKKGDRGAFEQLVLAHQAGLRQFCRLLLRDDAEADDAAQEAFFKAYQKIAQFNGKGTFKSWLLGIAANHCKDALRARKHAPVLANESIAEVVEAGGIGILGAEEEQIALKHLTEIALEQVPVHYRTVLVLREVAGFEYTEIAKLLSCSLDAVKARLRRARQEFGAAVRANAQ